MSTEVLPGLPLPCTASGAGAPILLVHGALADARMWQPHQALLAPQARALAVTLRYFSPDPWPADGPPFGITTHADDLAAFIRALGAGPVHLVAWSYSAHAALHLAITQPELLKSVFCYEPGFPTYVTDPAAMAAFQEDAGRMYAPLGEALSRGDLPGAVRSLMDASGQQPGYFDAQPEERRALQLDNAHTLPLLMAQTPPPVISAEDLAAIAAGSVT
jgi:pimeloyl-ACP methyl ester carboxylesterase